LAGKPTGASMGILSRLVSVSEEIAGQARQRVLDQRRALELLELRGDAAAVRRARMVLLNLEQAYRVALYRLRADRAVAGEAISGD
jgi:hypothetical protein